MLGLKLSILVKGVRDGNQVLGRLHWYHMLQDTNPYTDIYSQHPLHALTLNVRGPS